MEMRVDLLEGETKLLKELLVKISSRLTKLENIHSDPLEQDIAVSIDNHDDDDNDDDEDIKYMVPVYDEVEPTGTLDNKDPLLMSKCYVKLDNSVVHRHLKTKKICQQLVEWSENETLTETSQFIIPKNLGGRKKVQCNNESGIKPTFSTSTTKISMSYSAKLRNRKTLKIPKKYKAEDKKVASRYIRWLIYRTFDNAEEAEEFLNEEGSWQKSLCYETLKGKQQYFKCKNNPKCPTRRRLLYRKYSNKVELYFTLTEHDHHNQSTLE